MQCILSMYREGAAKPLSDEEEMRLTVCRVFKEFSSRSGGFAEAGIVGLIDAFLPRSYMRTCDLLLRLNDVECPAVNRSTYICSSTACHFVSGDPGPVEEQLLRDNLGNVVKHAVFTERSPRFQSIEFYVEDGLISRKDGPAIRCTSSTELYMFKLVYYMLEGRLHKDDGPAIVRRGTVITSGFTQFQYHHFIEGQPVGDVVLTWKDPLGEEEWQN